MSEHIGILMSCYVDLHPQPEEEYVIEKGTVFHFQSKPHTPDSSVMICLTCYFNNEKEKTLNTATIEKKVKKIIADKGQPDTPVCVLMIYSQEKSTDNEIELTIRTPPSTPLTVQELMTPLTQYISGLGYSVNNGKDMHGRLFSSRQVILKPTTHPVGLLIPKGTPFTFHQFHHSPTQQEEGHGQTLQLWTLNEDILVNKRCSVHVLDNDMRLSIVVKDPILSIKLKYYFPIPEKDKEFFLASKIADYLKRVMPASAYKYIIVKTKIEKDFSIISVKDHSDKEYKWVGISLVTLNEKTVPDVQGKLSRHFEKIKPKHYNVLPQQPQPSKIPPI